MSVLNDLVSQIEDKALRDRIASEVDRLSKQKKYGLVFEEHLPECTPLYDVAIKWGSTVAPKDGSISDVYYVTKIQDGVAECVRRDDKTVCSFAIDNLIAVAEFGDPIYPYLKPIDSVCNAPDNKLWHTLIEADNYHALQLLDYLYAGKVDVIYIDPPYNTRAKDWKYNNDYVDDNDEFRHSKWLSMMEKRLKLAKKLLSDTGFLILAIDAYELYTIGLLLDEIFGENNRLGLVTVQHNPKGRNFTKWFSANSEYMLVYAKNSNIASFNEIAIDEEVKATFTLQDPGDSRKYRLEPFMRSRTETLRENKPNFWYPLYVSDDLKIITRTKTEGFTEVYPIAANGKEATWINLPETFDEKNKIGWFVAKKEEGKIVIYRKLYEQQIFKNVWLDKKYQSEFNGTNLIKGILASNRFDYPKSLYLVEDILKITAKKDALVVDFFAGSGTTLHAVELLNEEDGGNRRCIIVTNNEVSASEAEMLKKKGLKPTDREWEKLGIAHHVTWPRTVGAIKGCDVNGKPLSGNYIGSDIPMSRGLKANAIFFKLGFLDKNEIALGKQFKELLPILWMKAGAIGKCPTVSEETPLMLVLPENHFAVLVDEKHYMEFIDKLDKHPEIKTVYIVTNSDAGYRDMIVGLEDKETFQLYRNYLDNFRINSVRR